MQVVLDGRCMTEREEMHLYLQEKLDFPAYYGRNLDALYDCLTEMDEAEIILENAEDAGVCFERAYQVMLKACQENPGLDLAVR